MKKLKLVLVVAFMLALFVGCGPRSVPPSGVMPGMLISSVEYPSMQSSVTNFTFKGEDIEILGPVSVSTSSTNILGLFAFGSNGYGELMREANKKYKGEAEGLVSIVFDTKYTNVCFMLYSKVTSNVSATAVRFKRK